MSRPKLLPPLAPETLAALERIRPGHGELAPRHEVNAEADPRLLEIVRELDHAERHLRFMAGPGEIAAWGDCDGKPTTAAEWAKRSLDALTEVCRVADEAQDAAFPLHLEAIRRGRENPPLPMRWQVWMAWKWCSISGLKRSVAEIMELIEGGGNGVKRRPYVPTAGEVAAAIGSSDKVAELSVRDCTNHLKALGLKYAPAKRGGRKSI